MSCNVNFFKVVQGDSFSLHIDLFNEDGTPYILQTGEIITLSVAHPSDIENKLIEVTGNNSGSFVIDSVQLGVGRYLFDVCLTDNNGINNTIVEAKNNILIVEPKVGGLN